MDNEQNPLPPYPPNTQPPVAPQPPTPQRVENIPELPKPGMKKIWLVLIAIIVVGGIGFGSYTFANNKATKEKNDLQAKIDDLTSTVNQMNTNLNTNTNTAIIANSNANTNSVVDPTANWNTYTNSTYKYTIKYPTTWTFAQASTVDTATEETKNATINLTSINATKLTIITVAKTKYSGINLNQFATDYITPKDKTTITAKSASTIGSLSGYQEMVTISDPASAGIWYFAENSNYFFVFTSEESTQSTDIKSILSTFVITS